MSEKEFDPRQHIVTLKDKSGRPRGDYLPVAARVLWFRQPDECPDWSIETEIHTLDVEAGLAIVRATICDDQGRVRATATALETRAGFPDWLEKSETSAIGRALALLGYGTLGALDEGAIVDTPQGNQQQSAAAGSRGNRGSELPPAAAAAAGPHAAAQAAHHCTHPDCGAILTKGQHEFSTKKFGAGLCVTHQQEAAKS